MPRHEKLSEIRPPTWLTRAEKRAFRRLIEAHFGTKRQVSAGQADAIADYVASRSRVAALTKLWRRAVRPNSDFALLDAQPNEREIAALARQIDSTTSLSRRLAEQLGLE